VVQAPLEILIVSLVDTLGPPCPVWTVLDTAFTAQVRDHALDRALRVIVPAALEISCFHTITSSSLRSASLRTRSRISSDLDGQIAGTIISMILSVRSSSDTNLLAILGIM